MTGERELSWAAGFFEGEGAVMLVTAHSSRSFPRLSAEVSQVDRSPLDWLHARWGGPIYAVTPKSGKGQPSSRWIVTAQQALVFLLDIRPYLVTERIIEKVELGIAFQQQRTCTWENRTPAYATRQWEFFDRMRALNERGNVANRLSLVEARAAKAQPRMRSDLTELERAVLSQRAH